MVGGHGEAVACLMIGEQAGAKLSAYCEVRRCVIVGRSFGAGVLLKERATREVDKVSLHDGLTNRDSGAVIWGRRLTTEAAAKGGGKGGGK